MATPTIVEVLSDSDSGAAASVTTGAGTQVGDLLVAAFGNNYFDGAGMAAPTGTAGTWTQKAYGDAGINTAHLRLYTREVTSGGAQTVTVSPVSSEEVYLFVHVLRGWSAVDDAQSNASATQTTSPVAPSATATGVDDLLLCFWQTGAPHGGPTFTAAPSGMTDLQQVADPAGPFSRLGTARQTLAASGATGTRTATINSASQYAACSIVIAGASSGAAGSGRTTLAATATSAARKVAAVSARACVAALGRAVARKAAPAGGRTAVAVVSAGLAKKAAPAAGSGATVVAGRAVARKSAPSAGRAAAIGLPLVAAHKLAAGTAAAPLASVCSAAASKRAPAVGVTAAAVWSYRSQVVTRPVTAVCSVAVVGSAAARKVLPASAVTLLAAYGRASAAHVALAAGAASAAVTGRAQTGRVSVVTGLGVLSVAASAGARKAAPAAGRAYALVLPLLVVPQEEADLAGSLRAADGPRSHLATSADRVAVLSSMSSSAVLRGGDE
ncbi:hypothetical protein ETD86_34835 [Nonomuraea turkmeniaca]|uniref:Uncharacterized protein n=1 Tax=Nonomuraea turkmeniaca TaxID=103838 RepID=A0A5S4F6U2_9ACTN|nr:hypothetical protein [Nonomuraea turkmeniaca]TMR11747.1 hypothetical protein ETD86_34835 [Nonomuraea turkmeniaca]